MTILALEGVAKRFGGVEAVRSLTFSVEAHQILGVMGANGAGKTTLFSLIAGNQKPNAGTILLDGHRIDGLRPDQICRRGIARTYQIVRPFAGMTVLENVALAAQYGSRRLASQAEAAASARHALEDVGLADEADRPAADLTLSGRKRLEIARALATGPRILMLDEVLAGLTATEIAEALDMVRALHRRHGLTLLVIEHVMRALMRLCDRIVVLHHGEKLAEGTPAEVAADTRVIEAYLGRGRA